jgi:iron complex outermembrane receptor protein
MNEYYSLDVGIKAEYFELNNTFELSPQIRGSYRYNDQHLWLGIGRAVVSPSYFELKSDYIVFYGDGIVDLFKANTEIKNERVLTIDAGYRLIKDNYSIDATAFISTYENVRGSDNTSSSTDAVWVYESNDDYEAKTYGAEVAIEWDINQSVKNHTSYSYLSFSQERVDGDLSSLNADDYWEIDHQNMISNQLLWQVTTTLQWDFVLNYKDIDYKDSYVDVDDLFSLNTRLGWQKHEHAPLVEVMINNIGMSSKCELETYTDDNSCRGYESEQSIYGRVSYEF